MPHSRTVEVPQLCREWPVVSLPCVGDNLAGWVAVDGIESWYRVAAHPVSLPHVVQFPSEAGLGFSVNMGHSLLSSFPWYGISLL